MATSQTYLELACLLPRRWTSLSSVKLNRSAGLVHRINGITAALRRSETRTVKACPDGLVVHVHGIAHAYVVGAPTQQATRIALSWAVSWPRRP